MIRRLASTLLLAGALLASGAGGGSAGAAVSAAAKAPQGPPLVSPGASSAGGHEGAKGPARGRRHRARAIGSLSSGTGDPLVNNGMGSPLCSYATRGGLSGAAAANCRTDDFVASGAPTGDYAFDIHIDRGVLGVGENNFAATIQNVILTPVWTALVWTAHTLLVGIEWCYTLNLLQSPAMRSINKALRAIEATFTEPWLVVVMSAAAVLAAYHGIVRRRVAETTGQVLMMLAMMAAGLWVIFDPLGTVGALGGWADEASIGTLGAVAHGSPARAPESLAGSMAELFESSIEGPWCYMEFGNVSWCRNPSNLDPALHRAALAVAEKLPSEPGEGGPHSAELIRAAKSNGELFLALPANGDKRNSINDTSSLLRVLCQTPQATECSGPTASEAEFRTPGFTMARAVGLLLILAGLAGMFLTLGFLVMRLLEAALATLIYLLMAPAAVLAPALGDGGRAAFRSWGARLLGSIASKIIYSFVLGLLLLILAFLVSLESLGWWIQWLLISVLWWSAFRQRHKLLGLAVEPRHSLRGTAGRFMGLPRYAESSMVVQGVQWARRRHNQREEQAKRRREAEGGTPGGEGAGAKLPPDVGGGRRTGREEGAEGPPRDSAGREDNAHTDTQETTDSAWAPDGYRGGGGEMPSEDEQGDDGAKRDRLGPDTEQLRSEEETSAQTLIEPPEASAGGEAEGRTDRRREGARGQRAEEVVETDRGPKLADRGGEEIAGRGARPGSATGVPERRRASRSSDEEIAADPERVSPRRRRGAGNRVMEDAFAVEEGRKRQLGYAQLTPSEPAPGPSPGDHEEDGDRR